RPPRTRGLPPTPGRRAGPAGAGPGPPSTNRGTEDPMTRRTVTLSVNGQREEILVEPRRLLCDALRDDLGLTGTHVGCEHGVCGACTVLLDNEPVRACLMFAVTPKGARPGPW